MAFFSVLLISGCGDKDKKKEASADVDISSYVTKCNKAIDELTTCIESNPTSLSALQSCETDYDENFKELAESVSEEQKKLIRERLISTGALGDALLESTESTKECASKPTVDEITTCSVNSVKKLKEKLCNIS